MFDKKNQEKLDTILASAAPAEDKFNDLCALFNQTCHSFAHKNWAETVLFPVVDRFMEENNISIGGMLASGKVRPDAM